MLMVILNPYGEIEELKSHIDIPKVVPENGVNLYKVLSELMNKVFYF